MLLSELTSFIDANRYKGRREAFGFEGFELKTYLLWAFSFDYLFVVSDESGINGVGVAYPLAKSYDGNQETLFSFAKPVEKSKESQHELCIMDWVANSRTARKTLVQQFKTRFPFWESQKKWGLQFGEVKELSNKYINLLTI
jgi:hypothetical protein